MLAEVFFKFPFVSYSGWCFLSVLAKGWVVAEKINGSTL